MAKLTEWLESTDRYQAKQSVGQMIAGLKFFWILMILFYYAVYKGLYICIVDKICKAQKYLEEQYLGPE